VEISLKSTALAGTPTVLSKTAPPSVTNEKNGDTLAPGKWNKKTNRWMTSPPPLHNRACYKVNLAPHPSHLSGRFAGVLPYCDL